MFWSERYVDCKPAIKQAEITGTASGPYREIHFRSEQAKNILKKFGANIDMLDARVVSITESRYAKT
jgi:hypothetical protein